MKKYKVEYYVFHGDGNIELEYDYFSGSPDGYRETADLTIRIKEEGTNNCYDLSFLDADTYTEIENYTRTPGSYWEPEEVDWDESETYLYLKDDNTLPDFDEIEVVSGEELDGDDISEEELRYIINQLPIY